MNVCRLTLCAVASVLVIFLTGCAGVDKSVGEGSFVEVTGIGIPALTAVGESQKRTTALEAARHDALAKLAEEIHGVYLHKECRVRDMTFAGMEVDARVSGELLDWQVVSRSYDDETQFATVTVRGRLNGP